MKRNKKPVFLMDVDGVALMWVEYFGQYAQSQGHKLVMDLPTTWEMTEWFNADHTEIRRLIKDMNGSELFEAIPAFEDAKRVLPLIAEKYDLVAITCCSNDPLTIARRKKNLELLNVKFKDVHCLNFTDSKLDLLKEYPSSFWVEDRFEGAKSGVEAGHTSFLINRTYNQNENHDRIIRVNGWEEILNKVMKKEQKTA